ncbi:hypothetical protein CMO89_03075 [Candidatus Woesearchaeota archaeon]|nr:hypothetical protein [Candidatus Woesearchaeota archaeon]|tara:strand:+ start:3296 stop:4411 length:1116 start_codon:yes stop_codon:yes gene_type:complete
MRKNRILLTIIMFLVFLGSGLYSVFIPIFLLKQGVSFAYIVVYAMSYCLGGIIAGMLFNYVIHKFSIKLPFIATCIFEPVIIFTLSFYSNFRLPVWVYGLLLGIFQFMFWCSVNVITLKATERHKRGKQQAFILSSLWVAKIISPFAGGAIIHYLGYSYLYVIGIAIVLCSCVPVMLLKQEVVVKRKTVFFPSLKGDIGVYMIVSFFRGISFSALFFFWVLYIYNLLGTELKVGSFSSLGSLLGLSAVLITGYSIDHFRKVLTYASSLLLSSVSWLFSVFNSSFIGIFILNLTNSFVHQTTTVTNNVLFLHEIEDKDVPAYTAERQIAFSMGAVILCLFAFFNSFRLLFVISSLGYVIALPFVFRLKNVEN